MIADLGFPYDQKAVLDTRFKLSQIRNKLDPTRTAEYHVLTDAIAILYRVVNGPSKYIDHRTGEPLAEND